MTDAIFALPQKPPKWLGSYGFFLTSRQGMTTVQRTQVDQVITQMQNSWTEFVQKHGKQKVELTTQQKQFRKRKSLQKKANDLDFWEAIIENPDEDIYSRNFAKRKKEILAEQSNKKLCKNQDPLQVVNNELRYTTGQDKDNNEDDEESDIFDQENRERDAKQDQLKHDRERDSIEDNQQKDTRDLLNDIEDRQNNKEDQQSDVGDLQGDSENQKNDAEDDENSREKKKKIEKEFEIQRNGTDSDSQEDSDKMINPKSSSSSNSNNNNSSKKNSCDSMQSTKTKFSYHLPPQQHTVTWPTPIKIITTPNRTKTLRQALNKKISQSSLLGMRQNFYRKIKEIGIGDSDQVVQMFDKLYETLMEQNNALNSVETLIKDSLE